jgi:hypothetical protein
LTWLILISLTVLYRNIFFTDPPYGLQDGVYQGQSSENHPLKELSFNGVYVVRRLPDGSLQPGPILVSALPYPNGVAYSKNLNGLFIANSDPDFPFLYLFNLSSLSSLLQTGTTALNLPYKIFFDYRYLPFKNANGLGSIPDGLKVNAEYGLVITNSATGLVMIEEATGQFLRMYPQYITGTTVNFVWSSDWIYMTAGGTVIGMRLGKEDQDFQSLLSSIVPSSQVISLKFDRVFLILSNSFTW